MRAKGWSRLSVLGIVVLAIAAPMLLFDWNLLRGPLERMASRQLQREVQLGALAVDLGWRPVIRLRDLRVANPAWAQRQPLARAREVEITVDWGSLFKRPIVLPLLRLTDAEINLERRADGSASWQFGAAGRKSGAAPPVQLRALRLDAARLSYRDDELHIRAQALARTRVDPRFPTVIGFAGQWNQATFAGRADTGSLLSLTDSGMAFPLKLALQAGPAVSGITRVEAEGEITDLVALSRLDMQVAIDGPSLASLYPSLQLPLPASPPYRFTGRLTKRGATYGYAGFSGKVGATDLAGDGELLIRAPRPLLTASLRSRSMHLADLGPLVGVERGDAARATEVARKGARAGATKPPGGGSERTARRASAKTGDRDGRLLPTAEITGKRLTAIDARVTLDVGTLTGQGRAISVDALHVDLTLANGELKLDPLRFALAGGEVLSTLVLDSRAQPNVASVAIDLRRLKLAELFSGIDQLKQSGGRLGAQLRLRGQGNSVAALLGSADGSATLGMAGGRISHLVLAAATMNGGRLLQLLLGGDRPAAIRCGGTALAFRAGVGSITAFVFDTEDVLVLGEGAVDFRREQLDLTLRPQPKRPGVLSVRGPVQVRGDFRNPQIGVSATTVARSAAAAALALVNPLAALLPLIESGPGQDAQCADVLAPVQAAARQADSASDRPPEPPQLPAPKRP